MVCSILSVSYTHLDVYKRQLVPGSIEVFSSIWFVLTLIPSSESCAWIWNWMMRRGVRRLTAWKLSPPYWFTILVALCVTTGMKANSAGSLIAVPSKRDVYKRQATKSPADWASPPCSPLSCSGCFLAQTVWLKFILIIFCSLSKSARSHWFLLCFTAASEQSGAKRVRAREKRWCCLLYTSRCV